MMNGAAPKELVDTVEPVQKLKLNSENLVEAWKEFRQHFEIYLMATESTGKPDAVRVAILLHVIGTEAVKIFNTFNMTEAEKLNLNCVLTKFEEYCTTPKRNQLYDTYLFEKRRQAPNEKFDTFVDDLRRMVTFCGYANEERMVRDRIVFGALDRKLQKQLIVIDELDLTRAIEMGRVAEMERDEYCETYQQPIEMEPYGRSNYQYQQPGSPSWLKKLCAYCNLSHPYHVRCPAHGKICKYCNKVNHYSGACRRKQEDDARLLEELTAKYDRARF